MYLHAIPARDLLSGLIMLSDMQVRDKIWAILRVNRGLAVRWSPFTNIHAEAEDHADRALAEELPHFSNDEHGEFLDEFQGFTLGSVEKIVCDSVAMGFRMLLASCVESFREGLDETQIDEEWRTRRKKQKRRQRTANAELARLHGDTHETILEGPGDLKPGDDFSGDDSTSCRYPKTRLRP